jgi:hypothetical protein
MTILLASDWEGSGVTDSGKWDGEISNAAYLSVATDQKLQNAHSLKVSAALSTKTDYVYKTISLDTFGLRVGIMLGANSGLGYLVTMAGALHIGYNASTGHLNVYDSGGITLGGIAFSLSTWYQIDTKYDKNSYLDWKIWDATGKNILASGNSSPFYPSTASEMDVGDCSTCVGTFWIDSLVLTDSGFPGPLKGSFYPFPSFNPSY